MSGEGVLPPQVNTNKEDNETAISVAFHCFDILQSCDYCVPKVICYLEGILAAAINSNELSEDCKNRAWYNISRGHTQLKKMCDIGEYIVYVNQPIKIL